MFYRSPVAAHRDLEIRRLLHAAREPVGSFSVYIGLLERERLPHVAQAYVQAIRANMKRAADAFEEIDFWLDNGYPRSTVATKTIPPANVTTVSQRAPVKRV